MTAPDRPDADVPKWFKREPSTPDAHVAPDPAPRRPTVADVMRDAFDAMDAQHLPSPEQSAVHAAERAFLAAYRAQRDAWRALRGGVPVPADIDERIATLNRLTEALDKAEAEYPDAQRALDAADAALEGAEVQP